MPAARGFHDAPAEPLRRPRLRWLRAKDWDEHLDDLRQMAESPGFQALRDEIIELAALEPGDRLLDIGAGTGLLALAAAARVAQVSALDISPVMCRHLQRRCGELGIDNATVLQSSATELPLPDGELDVVVSNYCFHHLSHPDKSRALREIMRVLRPGGRLVLGDMMFGLSVSARRDRAVIARLVVRMLKRGPAGIWRLAKNAARILAGRWEQPASTEWWQAALLGSGFTDVSVRALAHEGGIAVARKP